MRQWVVAVSLLFSVPGLADPWIFGDRIAVTPRSNTNVFHHLDSSGRKSIAVSDNFVAIVWEDNRSGAPQAYLALKTLDSAKFGRELQASNGHVAYGPSIVSLGNGRFLIGWEQDDAVWVRAASESGLDPAVRVDGPVSSQITLGSADHHEAVAAWSRRDGRHTRIMTTTIDFAAGKPLRIGTIKPVDPTPPADDQLYPTVAVTETGVAIAWEDRRRGHTILLYTHALAGKPFGDIKLLNEPVQKSTTEGRGSGVARPALAVYGENRMAAAWMDKRGYQTGYDIYAAFSQDGGVTFGANELVQDAFAEEFSQWHPAIAGGMRGQIVVAWDDDRDGTSDIWYSWKTNAGWSGDHTFAAASGNGQQTNPAITLDDHNNLHVLWIDQATEDGPSQLFYTQGRYQLDKE